MNGVLAILGSGEIAPGMTKVHRAILAGLDSVIAVNVDTAYGFQENVPQMSEKIEEYFKVSLNTPIETLHFPSFAVASDVERALFRQRVAAATYVFAGPGSPSYALAQWTPLDFGRVLEAVLEAGGTLCISSAAALTLGAFTVPVYEIYKVGLEPYWLDGLNVLARAGLDCVVIPHFDNNEGENYDTRFCYLGERRLRTLQQQLPESTATLGIDEHTAAIFDFTRDTVTIQGKARAYWNHGDAITTLENGSTTPLETIRTTHLAFPPSLPVVSPPLSSDVVALAQIAAQGGPEGTEALASLVELARAGGRGFVDPAPLVEGILAARTSARNGAHFTLADELRDCLLRSGFDVHDGPDGTSWSRHSDAEH